MFGYRIEDWSDAYTNQAHIAGGERWPAAWMEPAKAFRLSLSATGRARLDLAYGHGERRRFDLFLPQGKPKGLAVFVHGGYWMAFDKSYWSQFAAGPVARGYAVALPSYTLCPENRIAGITADTLGLHVAIWLVAGVTLVSGLVVAVRMRETHRALIAQRVPATLSTR